MNAAVRSAWRHPLVYLALGLLAIALAQPFDLPLSRLFYRAGDGFFLRDTPWAQAVYRGTPWLARGFGVLLVLGLAASYAPRSTGLHARRGLLWFVLLALALGPGLVTNTLLKDHWGRPRPVQIDEFGGSAHYLPPWQPGTQCARNCSFVGGHAAMGFFVITGAWVWPRRRAAWLAAGIATGALVGFVRIVQGGHFLSDIVGALAVVWLSNEALYRWMSARSWLAQKDGRPQAPA